jgi:membrane associated rhomboid family serine protease
MVTASVGFQCPECARQGAAQQRLVDVHRRATTPYVTYALIALNVAVFLVGSVVAERVTAGGVGGDFTARFGVYTPCVGQGQWYRLITGGFLHAGFLHVAMNMWALWVLGPPLEVALGRVRFVILYAVSLLGGALGVVVVDRLGDPALTVGASGAIFGLLGALVLLQRSRGIGFTQSGLAGVIGLNLLITFAIPGISIGGHIGGLVVGAAAAAVMLEGRPLAAQAEGEQVARSVAAAVVGLGCLTLALVLAQAIAAPPFFSCPA